MKKITLFCLCFCLISSLRAQTPSPGEVLSESIKHHDPQGIWSSDAHALNLKETRPNGSDRITNVMLDISNEHFRLQRQSDGHEVIQELAKGKVKHLLDGKMTTDTAAIAKHRLSDDRARMMKNYYLYLYGLPMKLNDPGTQIDPTVLSEEFNEIGAWKLKVTYDPTVGDDIWYFYFAKDDYRLVGYRFYHDESANDGEYIVLEGEAKVGDLLLPASRKWYMHVDDKFLGTDIIINNE